MTIKDLDLSENLTETATIENVVDESAIINPVIKEDMTVNNEIMEEVVEISHDIENKIEELPEEVIEVSIETENHVEELTAQVNVESAEVEIIAPIEEPKVEEMTVQTEVVETELPSLIENISEETIAQNPVEEITAIEVIEETHAHEEVDYSNFEKKDFVDLGEKLLASIKKEGATIADIRNADNVMKEIKLQFDELKAKEKGNALKKYIADSGNDEGFEYKNDNLVVRFESLNAQIREAKNSFFQKIEKEKENYFDKKTQLLQTLREVVEKEEQGGDKNNHISFKKVQEDWKNAGNVNSPHNSSLWQAYNALLDRYFSIRNIQNELKDLDRKKNLSSKSDLVEKIEKIAASIEESGLTNTSMKQANELLEEYKHIGPAPRDEQEKLWQRLKAAFDTIHNKRREQVSQNSQLQDEVYEAKARIVENIKPFAEFNTDSINEWNLKTKEVLAVQDQWNAIKGAMPREKGKDISNQFWAYLKSFFRNKSEFFNKLEAERESNLKAKEALCEQVEGILNSSEFTAVNTDKVIELQKSWKTIGHVPEKQKDKIFERFKKACDAFFDGKRNKTNETEKEYELNLKKKESICAEIEAAAKGGNADLVNLPEFKASFNAVGYVPRKDMQSIQKRFVDAVNAFVKASSGISNAEKEKIMLQNETEVVLKGDKAGSKNLDKKEGDIRRRMKTIEDDINVWRNNIEFFARSKNADSVRKEYESKIKTAEVELNDLKQKLKIILSAN
jgi:hypothetical protein